MAAKKKSNLFNFVPPALKNRAPTPQPKAPTINRGVGGSGGAGSFTGGGGTQYNLGASASGANVPYQDAAGNTFISGPSARQWEQYEARQAGGMPTSPSPTSDLYGFAGGNSGGGGRAGGGGGGGPMVTQADADSLFAFNADPYAKWRAGIEEQYRFNPAPYEAQTAQANAYNPDFAAMEAEAVGRVNAGEQARQAEVQRRLEMIQSMTNQVGQGYATNMQGALRDLAGQGIDTGQYVNQASAAGANLAAGGANQLGLGGNLDRIAMQNQGDTIRGMGLVRQGGEANLANNRSTLLNQIAAQRAAGETAMAQQRAGALGQVGVAEAQAQMSLEQAKREFMLKYGL